MLSAEELLKQAKLLNEDKKHDEAIELLSDILLEKHRDTKLYYEKGRSYYLKKEYHNAIECFTKAIKIDPIYNYPYNGLGNAYKELNDYDKAIESYNQAIKLNPKYENPYYGLGTIFRLQKNYDKAIESYNQAIKLNPNDEYPHNGLGNIYDDLKNYEKAIDYFNKSIEINPQFEYSYFGLGYSYNELKDFNKSIEFYSKAISINPSYARSYYNRANVYQTLKKYYESLEDFQKYIELTKDNPDYLTDLSKSRVVEIEKLIKNVDYSAISELVVKIKDLLLFKDNCITHYTSLSVTKILILKEDSLFRLSEGAFLNDTSEGRELFDFLPALFAPSGRINETEAKPFSSKPFVGSFVSKKKHDDLTLWRMYGKENKEEARGCAITITREKLLEDLKNSLVPDDKANPTEKSDEEFNFYRVAYRNQDNQDNKDCFAIPGAPGEEQTLNKLMTDLFNNVNGYLKKKIDLQDVQNLIELLNRIAFLFKSLEYQYEHEVRLVVTGTGIPKIIDNDFSPPRVYINLVGIRPLIERITLGPKVERAEEWASAFYYSLDKQDLHPEILISHLPFK